LKKHPLSKAMKQRSPQNALGFRGCYHTKSRMSPSILGGFSFNCFYLLNAIFHN
jgi:hypothetical protein